MGRHVMPKKNINRDGRADIVAGCHGLINGGKTQISFKKKKKKSSNHGC